MALNKPIETLTEDDLQALIADLVSEDQAIEYKKALVLDNEPAKAEFRKDVSSFANTLGGYMIVGMEEDKGVPTNLCGMAIDNADHFKMRLDELLQTKISPRILGVAIRCILLANGNMAVVIHVPRSFAKPHQITINKDDYQFWVRNSAGTYRLTVDELRSIILQSDGLEQRIRNFRLERLGNIMVSDTPVLLTTGARIVLHLLPIGAFDPRTRYDLTIFEYPDLKTLAPLGPLNMYKYSSAQYNLDGFLTKVQVGNTNEAMNYLQIFRNGIVESVDAYSINQSGDMPPYWSHHHEQILIDSVSRHLALQQQMDVGTPILLMVTLIGVQNHGIYRGPNYMPRVGKPFGRETLLLPDVLINNYHDSAACLLRPIFDAIWNAGGDARCENYNKEGQHVLPY